MKYLHSLPFFLIPALVFLTGTCAFSQSGDSTIIVKGYVTDSETLADLGGVHIYNSRGNITISDIKGFFRMRVTPGDTLTFSRIDYETKRLVLNGETSSDLVVTMQQKIYILDTVDILGEYTVPSYLLKPEQKPVYIEGVTRYANTEKDYHLGVGGSLSSPATAIYQMFSKRYKEEKKAYNLEKKEVEENLIKDKAYKKIEEILEINEIRLFPEQYDQLVQHCNLNLEWVANANNYDLYLRMENCLDSYLKQVGLKEK